MWRKIKVGFVVSIITLSLGMTFSSAIAQTGTHDEVGSRTTTMRDDNAGYDLGWIGLAGLAGLVGLMPRDRKDPNLTR